MAPCSYVNEAARGDIASLLLIKVSENGSLATGDMVLHRIFSSSRFSAEIEYTDDAERIQRKGDSLEI